MLANKANVDKYLSKTAHEIGKKKTKNTKIAESDPEVQSVKEHLSQCVLSGGPNVKEVVSVIQNLINVQKKTKLHKLALYSGTLINGFIDANMINNDCPRFFKQFNTRKPFNQVKFNLKVKAF